MSPISGAIISSKLATKHELETIYGIEDAYDFLEILSINAHNQRIASRPKKA